MTAQEFAAWELEKPERHEFFRGEVFRVFEMGAARCEHVRVTMNLSRLLDNHLHGTPCQAFMADMKVHVVATGDMFYPDVLVTCKERDLAASLEMHHYKLIIEMLSPSTATLTGQRVSDAPWYRSAEGITRWLIRTTRASRSIPGKPAGATGC